MVVGVEGGEELGWGEVAEGRVGPIWLWVCSQARRSARKPATVGAAGCAADGRNLKLEDGDVLAKLLALNLERAAGEQA